VTLTFRPDRRSKRGPAEMRFRDQIEEPAFQLNAQPDLADNGPNRMSARE